MADSNQLGMDFTTAGRKDGYLQWQESRRQARQRLAREAGLPLEHLVEVRLYDGVVLRGVLNLKEELLFLDEMSHTDLELKLGRASFNQSEIESCVRLD